MTAKTMAAVEFGHANRVEATSAGGPHTVQVTGIDVSSGGCHLASCASDGSVHLYNERGLTVARYVTRTDGLGGLAFDPTGQLLLSGGRTPRVQAVDPWVRRASFRGHKQPVVGLSLSGAWLASAGEQEDRQLGEVRVWDPESGRLRWRFTLPSPAQDVTIAQDRVLALSGCLVHEWDLRTGASVRVFDARELHGQGRSVLRVSPAGQWLACGGRTSVVQVTDMGTTRIARRLVDIADQHSLIATASVLGTRA